MFANIAQPDFTGRLCFDYLVVLSCRNLALCDHHCLYFQTTQHARPPITDKHYDDVIMTMLASQITSLTVVYSIVYSDVNQRKHQSSASLAFVREIHRGPVNFPHKWPVTRKMFPFDDFIMFTALHDVKHSWYHGPAWLNTLRPGQNGRHFLDDIFK